MTDIAAITARTIMKSIPGALNGPLSSLPLLGAPRWEFFLRREMVQRIIEATEKSFNDGLLGSAVVSVVVVAAILAVAL